MSSEHSAAPVLVAATDEVVISADHVGKSYQMYESPAHRLWQVLLGKKKIPNREFQALGDVTFQIRRGETVGIIGRNGSGKSTLLQLIAGTLTPSRGKVTVRGRIAALLELGSGFNPEFTGRENVYLNASILGLKRDQIDRRMERIIAFADIGDFIDQPVRSYSSGMAVRLAFAVVAHVDADILIIDEALSVGDAFFAQKCMRFLRDFQKTGTLLFVSHDAAAVINLCERAIWLEAGAVRAEGASQDVMEAYMTEQHVAARQGEGEQLRVKVKARGKEAGPDFRAQALRSEGAQNRMILFEFDPDAVGTEFGAGAARVENVELLGEDGLRLSVFEGGEVVRLVITSRLFEPLDRLIAGFYVKDRLGQRLFGDNTFFAYRNSPLSGPAGATLRAAFTFRMPTMPSGSYMLDVAIASGDQSEHTQQHWIHDALEFRAVDETMRYGLVGLPMLSIEAEVVTS